MDMVVATLSWLWVAVMLFLLGQWALEHTKRAPVWHGLSRKSNLERSGCLLWVIYVAFTGLGGLLFGIAMELTGWFTSDGLYVLILAGTVLSFMVVRRLFILLNYE